jgi:hypothetical protein
MAEAILLHSLPIPIKPFWLDLLLEPLWDNSCQYIEGVAQCFSDQFEGIEGFHCSKHMRGISSLPSTSAEIASLPAEIKEGI